MRDEIGPPALRRVKDEEPEEKENDVKESFTNLYKKLAMLSEESEQLDEISNDLLNRYVEKGEESHKDLSDKAKAARKVAYQHMGTSQLHNRLNMKLHNKADSRGDYLNKAKERLNTEEPEQYDDKKEKVDEWANNAGPGKTVSDTTFEQDIDFMTKVISGGLNKQKSTGQATVPVVASQLDRLTSHETTGINESVSDWKKLAGIK
jgi:exonuclease VII large subunit